MTDKEASERIHSQSSPSGPKPRWIEVTEDVLYESVKRVAMKCGAAEPHAAMIASFVVEDLA